MLVWVGFVWVRITKGADVAPELYENFTRISKNKMRKHKYVHVCLSKNIV